MFRINANNVISWSTGADPEGSSTAGARGLEWGGDSEADWRLTTTTGRQRLWSSDTAACEVLKLTHVTHCCWIASV